MSDLNMLKAQDADLRSMSAATGLSCDAPSNAPDSNAVRDFRLAMEKDAGSSSRDIDRHAASQDNDIPSGMKGQLDAGSVQQFASLFSMDMSSFNDGVGSVSDSGVAASPLSEADLEMLVDRILVHQLENGSQEVRISLAGHLLGGTEVVLHRNVDGMLVVMLNCTDMTAFQTLVASQADLRVRLEDFENKAVQVSVDISQDGNDAEKRSRGYTDPELLKDNDDKSKA